MLSVPEGDHGVKPDQDLLDGHFAGEHAASGDIDHKVSSFIGSTIVG